jgi:hypothetical protein
MGQKENSPMTNQHAQDFRFPSFPMAEAVGHYAKSLSPGPRPAPGRRWPTFHYLRAMFLRITASVLLACMTLVMAGAVMHAHEHGHEEETTRLLVSPLGDHEDGAAECSLCKVTKERVTVANAEVTFVVTYCVVQMRPFVQNLISDRCPQERTGRAPPRG